MSHCVSASTLLCSSCFNQFCLPLSIFFHKDKNCWFFLWLVIVPLHGIYFEPSFHDSINTDSLSQFICPLYEKYLLPPIVFAELFFVTLTFPFCCCSCCCRPLFSSRIFTSRISCFTYSSACLYLAQLVWIYFVSAVMVEWTCYYICGCSWYNDYCCFNTTLERNKNVTMKHTWVNSPQCVISFSCFFYS